MDSMTRTSFGDQLQQMWRTRPVRLPRRGPIAGVAAGFGQRYNVDPVLVRVAFVVSTIFGGAGIVLYLLAWLLCSAQGDETSAAESLIGKGHSSQSQTKTIVLIVALAIAVSAVGPIGVGLGGSGVIGLAAMLAGWWMLFMRTPEPPALGFGEVDGVTGTGYPGTALPQTTPLWTGQDTFESPTYGPYTPYTKLPERYVPEQQVVLRKESNAPTSQSAPPAADSSRQTPTDPAADSSTAQSDQNSTEVPEIERATEVIATTKATEVLGTGAGATEAIDSSANVTDGATTSLDKASSSTAEGAASPRVEPAVPRTSSTLRTGPLTANPTPPSWDPLGVAPLAWDLPEPSPAKTVVAPEPEKPRSRLTPMVLGLAILAAAGAGAAAASGVEWMTPGRIAAVALGVVGLGLILGAFLRRGYGLLVVTAPLAGFVVLASMIGPVSFDGATMGERTWTPLATGDLKPEYSVTMGSGTLDLRELDLTENRTVDVSVQMGEAIVLVPENMNVRADCTVRMGDAQCPEGLTGPGGDAPVLDLNIDVRAGSAEVRRG
ncbi:PspC domain-containing protein [Nocardia cyriacigeorgica]|uniref:PspC domain-containing protein n=1 Tax=Nocardia cyriacigeorgica TaxID=135487 RepID=A0ABX0CN36_9NOCA|nr:PspC domain-containing protein [Nocardia cyriacigeorgica]